MTTKEEVMHDLSQGVDIRQKEEVNKIKAEYDLLEECAEDWEKTCIKNKLSIKQMGKVWEIFQQRQNDIFVNSLVNKTERPKLVIRDRATGAPINI